MTWVIHTINALFLVWIVAAVSSRESKDCVTTTFLSKKDCITASDSGTTLGVVLIMILWFMVFVALALAWFMTRPKENA